MQTLDTGAVDFSEVVHENYSLPQAHPDRLSSLAKLFGLNAPAIESARVLQVGYAIGNNLIHLATDFPNGRFTGIELSSKHAIEEQSLIESMQLKNVHIECLDLNDVEKDLGRFDYIIMHGIFSWSSQKLQERLLQICSKNLSKHGVAYVSYNTYPGWHFRGMVRDMMLYHTAQFSELHDKTMQSRALLSFLSHSANAQNEYGMMLRDELELLNHQSDSYLLDDHLQRINEPIYFHQFAARAGAHQLQYLAEVELSSMLPSNFMPEVADTLRRVSSDIIRSEQYMDFVRNRAFRQTLLCHQDVKLKRNLDWRGMTEFRYSTGVMTLSDDSQMYDNDSVEFKLANGVALTTTRPLTKLALQHMSQIAPHSIPFKELLNIAIALLSAPSGTRQMHEQNLAADLLTACAAGIVELHMYEPTFTKVVSEQPMVVEFARRQAQTGSRITNQVHESIDADSFVRQIITLLDGTRNLKSLVSELERLVESGVLKVQQENVDVPRGQQLEQTLSAITEESLKGIAQVALLIS
jgi:methyltransferase-like protein/SAM-dependent methyltransferase